MKYSFLIPYSRRALHLQNTLVSYRHFYGPRDDFEIIIAEDAKNADDDAEHSKLMRLLRKFKDLNIKHLINYSEEGYNPAPAFNFAARSSLGKFLILTNPECFHLTNMLKGFDAHFKKNWQCYVICSCQDVRWPNKALESFGDFSYTFISWYQHSVLLPRGLHFCSALSRDNYDKLGGFDEDFKKGIAREDVDFIERVKRSGVVVIEDDSLQVAHLNHQRLYQNNPGLLEVNKQVYNRKWSS